MIDLESDTPVFHWSADGADVKLAQSPVAVERLVWSHTAIISYVIADSYVTFDVPPEWGDRISAIRLQQTPDGNYECHLQDTLLKGVRAETRSHVVITGRWMTARSDGTGVFIAVFPIKLSDELPLETATTVPEQSYVLAAMAHA